MNPQRHSSLLIRRCARYGRDFFEPLVLSVLLALQVQLFNAMLDIVPRLYLVRCTIVTLALGVLLYGPSVFVRPRFRQTYLFIVASSLAALFIAEYLYYSYSGAFLQASVFGYAGLSSEVTDTAATLLEPRMLIFLAGPFFVAAAAFWRRRKKMAHAVLNRWEKRAFGFGVAIVVLSGYGYVLAVEKRDHGNTIALLKRQYNQNTLVGKIGIANYFFRDAAERALNRSRVSKEDKAFVQQWARDRAAARAAEPERARRFSGMAKGRNLIVLQIESLEQAVIGESVGGQEITPTLNALAREGFSFTNYYAQIGLGTSADAEFATLNSLYPLPDNIAFLDFASHQYRALPKALAEKGYESYALHGDVATFWNRGNIYPSLGYKKMFVKDDYTISRPVGYQDLGDADFFSQSLPKIKAFPQPFMATLMTLSTHTPFALPPDLQTLAIPADASLNDKQKSYLQSVHYADAAIRNFVQELKDEGIYENSLIAIIGDHGSFQFFNDAFEKKQSVPADMRMHNVPLILLAPGTNLRGTSDAPAAHVDFFPTVANLLGVDVSASALGEDALNAENPVAVFRKPGSEAIHTILGSRMMYAAAGDGTFAQGLCVTYPDRASLLLDSCKSLYEKYAATVRASDAAVRGNWVEELLGINR